ARARIDERVARLERAAREGEVRAAHGERAVAAQGRLDEAVAQRRADVEEPDRDELTRRRVGGRAGEREHAVDALDARERRAGGESVQGDLGAPGERAVGRAGGVAPRLDPAGDLAQSEARE